MHIQLVHLHPFDSLFEKESTTRRKERNKNTYAGLMSKWTKMPPNLCVIHDIGKKSSLGLPPPRSVGASKKRLVHGGGKCCTNRKLVKLSLM